MCLHCPECGRGARGGAGGLGLAGRNPDTGKWRRRLTGGLLAALAVSLAACERETRRFREVPPTISADVTMPLEGSAVGLGGGYERNAWAVSEGKRLFRQYNCTGCHAQGGGAIGPALMDSEWIYGSTPEQIYATIVQGQPNGMPAYGEKVGASQVWQLVAYVRSLSGWIRKDVASGRDDGMQVKAQEQQTDEQPRRPPSGAPAGRP